VPVRVEGVPPGEVRGWRSGSLPALSARWVAGRGCGVEGGRAVAWEGLECRAGEEYVRGEVELPLRDFFTVVRVRGRGGGAGEEHGPHTQGKAAGGVQGAGGTGGGGGPSGWGRVLVRNLLGMGVDVVATGEVEG